MHAYKLANSYLGVTFNRAFNDSEMSKDCWRGYGEPNYNMADKMRQSNRNGKWKMGFS